MNLKKTVAQIRTLTTAVKDEADRRDKALAAHGESTNNLIQQAHAAFRKMMTALEKRQANKAIVLNNACVEARECLECLTNVGSSGGVQPADTGGSLVLQPAVAESKPE